MQLALGMCYVRNVHNKIVYMLSILGSGLYFYINMNLIGQTCGR